MNLDAAYEIARRQKWLILIVFFGVLACGVLYVVLKAPEYRAQSLLLVEEKSYDPTDALTYGRIAGLDNPNLTMHLLILSQSTLLSERVASQIMDAQTLPNTDERFSLLTEDANVRTIARRLQHDVIEIGSDATNLINVTATSLDPREAAYLANLFADEAVRQSVDISRGRVASSREFLEDRIEEGRMALEEAEQNLQQYLGREGAVALDQEAQAAIGGVARIEAALADAQIEHDIRSASLSATEEELLKIKPMLSQRLASGMDRELASSQERLTELEMRLEQIYFEYPSLRENPDQDPRIADMRRQIQQWRGRIEELSDQYVSEVLSAGGVDPSNPESGMAYAGTLERQLITDRIALSGLESKISALTAQRNQYEARLRTIPGQAAEVAELERARSSAQELYATLDQRFQEVLLAEEAETGSLRILRPADVPMNPVSPRPERVLPLVSFLALILGTGIATLRNRLDGRVYTPADIEEGGSHLLGVVPNMRAFLSKEFKKASTIRYEGQPVASTMVSLLAPESSIAEAYRHLYARVLPVGRRQNVRSIIVTSAEAGVGKSTTALNLAITAGLAGRRTLIVDVDLRRPAVERYLGVPEGLTLQDLTAMPIEAGLMSRILQRSATSIPNLHAVTVREPIGNPMEHLLSPRLRSLLELLKDEFAVIVFDAPPLLLAPDATLLAPLCDATIVVASAGLTSASALEQIENELNESGAHLTGIVLNRFDASNRNFKSTYGYLQNNYSAYYARVAM